MAKTKKLRAQRRRSKGKAFQEVRPTNTNSYNEEVEFILNDFKHKPVNDNV